MFDTLKFSLFLFVVIIASACADEKDPEEEELWYEGEIGGGLVYTFPEEINDVYFYENKVGDPDAIGFAIAKSGNIYKRIKGTYYWNWEVVAKTTSSYRSSIHALDQDRIIVSIHRPDEYILKSNDGGTTWKEVYRASVADAQNNFTPTEFLFVDDKNGFSFSGAASGDVGTEQSKAHYILSTKDGGDNWTKLELNLFLHQPNVDFGIWNMKKIGDDIFAMGTHFLYSKDLGITWAEISDVSNVYGVGKNADGQYIIGGSGFDGRMLTSSTLDGPWEHLDYESPVMFPPNIPGTISTQFPIIQRFHVWGNNAIAAGSNATWVSYDGCLTWKRPEGTSSVRTHNICYSNVDGAWYDLYTPGNTDRNTRLNRFELKPKL